MDFLNEITKETIISFSIFLALFLIGIFLSGFIANVLVRRMIQFLFKKLKYADIPDYDKFKKRMLRPLRYTFAALLIYYSSFYLVGIDQIYIWERGEEQFLLTELLDVIFLLAILYFTFWTIVRFIDFIFNILAYRASLTSDKFDDQMVPFFKELIKFVTVIAGVMVTLSVVFAVNITTLIAGLGIGGLAIALAAKESLENLIGSFTIFVEKPFIVGDYVRIKDIDGTVIKIGFRSTQIRTLEKSIVSIPNKFITDSTLENLTLRNYRRVVDVIPLALNTPLDKLNAAIKGIQDTISNHPKTSNDGIISYGGVKDSALQIDLLYFIEMIDYNEHLKIKEELNLAFLEVLQANDTKLAIPVRTFVQNYYKMDEESPPKS